MKLTRRRLCLSRWITICLLCFIWGNSLLPGEISEQLSNGLRDLLARLLPGEIPGVTSGGGLLRKIAHFTEFAALGATLCWRLGMLEKRKIMALAHGFGAACAFADNPVIAGRGFFGKHKRGHLAWHLGHGCAAQCQ